jgi:hypothetical protein
LKELVKTPNWARVTHKHSTLGITDDRLKIHVIQNVSLCCLVRGSRISKICGTFTVKGQAILLGLLDYVIKCTTVLQNVGKNTASTMALSVCQPQ